MHIRFLRTINLHTDTRILLCSLLLSSIPCAKLEAPRGFKGNSWERLPLSAVELESPVPERLEAGGKQSFNNALQALKKQGQVSFPGDPQPKSAKAPASKFKRRSGPGGQGVGCTYRGSVDSGLR